MSRLRAIVLTFVLTAQAVVAAPVLASDGVPDRPRSEAEQVAEQVVHDLHGQARSDPSAFGYGSEPPAPRMTGWTDVRDVARDWSDEQAAKDQLSHNPHVFSQLCCWRAAGENVAMIDLDGLDTAEVEAKSRVIFQDWMDSNPHRTTILDDRFDQFGVGVSILGPREHEGCGSAEHCQYWTMYLTANFRQVNGESPPGEPYGSADGVEVRRVADGSNGVGTSARLAREGWPGGVAHALLATSDAYPDALAAAALAGVHDAPLLLTPTDRLDQRVADAITALGVTHVFILGGPVAITHEVEQRLRTETGVTTSRLQGPTRFETAVEVAEHVVDRAPITTAFIVEGAHADPARGWPDAVSASSVAARGRTPILLVTRDGVPQPTRDAIVRLGLRDLQIVGGPAAVSEAVAAELASIGSVERVSRYAGAERFATSVDVVDRLAPAAQSVFVATGLDYRDALIAGPAAAHAGGISVLVHGTDAAGSGVVYEHLAAKRTGLDGVVVGSDVTVTEAVRAKVQQHLGG